MAYYTQQEMLETLQDYIVDSSYNHAILLTGSWGSGKTWFIKNCFIKKYKEKQKLKADNKELKAIVYVSLAGIRSYSELQENILLGEMDTNIKHLVKEFKVDTKLSIGDGLFSINGILSALGSASKFALLKTKCKNTSCVIFDDFERCALPNDEMLMLINHFVENMNMKVIIVADEAIILDGENSCKYSIAKEKVIGRTIEFSPSFKDTIASLVNKCASKALKERVAEQDITNTILNTLQAQKHFNLRTVQYIIDLINKISELDSLCRKGSTPSISKK